MSNLENHVKSDTIKWILTLVGFILVAVMLVGIICGWFTPKKKDKADEQPAEASVLDENGNEIADGKVHPMPVRMLFAMSSLAEDTSVTVEATVKPENATNKAVDWSVKWADESASWASGKTVTDYVTVTPTEDGSTTATVKNIAAFGEQVTSRDNPEASATCNVDYLQRIESATLKIGDVNVNFNGDTNVTVLVGKDTGGAGGTVTLEKNLATVYTVAETYTEKVSFTGGTPAGMIYDNSSEYVSYYIGGSMGGASKVYYDDIDNAVGRSIYFDRRLFSDYNFKYDSTRFNGQSVTTTTPFTEYDAQYIESSIYGSAQGKKFWDITVTFTGTHKTYTYTSALRWTGIDTTVPVSAMEMQSQDILF